jgi:predicted GH43/DUF377 family glycosyl hydrolase
MDGELPGKTYRCHRMSRRFRRLRCDRGVRYDPRVRYSERAIFPVSPTQAHGIEDARFVQFTDDVGAVTFYATYTDNDGRTTYPQLLKTTDFLHFPFNTLQGSAVQNKGMAAGRMPESRVV